MSEPFCNVLCWNPDARARVTNTIALDVDPAVFRATHSPSALRRVGAASSVFVTETEDAFLADFVSASHPHVLAAAVGESGAGKSHFIRWLYVELMRRSDSDAVKRHVVLVPRSSANLHAVVEQVVAGFDGPIVKQVRDELSRARGRLTERGAQHRVLDELAFVLGDENRPPRPGMAAPNDEERELRSLLSDFLRDGAVRNWLLESNTVVARLGDHIAGTRTSVSEEGQLLWHPDQLEVPPTVQQHTAGNAREAANLLMTDPAYQKLTADILNAAWGDASAALLGLRRGNLGGALAEIRKELFARKQELILLLEDLSVTQGLDEELMEALIVRPNERPGEPLCVLRSVVGLTPDDFAALRDNIRGRLHRVVDLSPPLGNDGSASTGRVNSDDVAKFAARYLNAARYTLGDLENWHSGPESTDPLPSYCVARECPHRSTCHAAFGAVEVEGGPVGLYPFTADTIVRLDEHARSDRIGATPKFNPRRLVGRVLNTVLASAERALPLGEHPTPHLAGEFGLAAVTARTQMELESRYGGEGARYRWALEIYSPQFPGLSDGIAQAFGLPVVAEAVTPPDRQPVGPKVVSQEPEQPRGQAETLDVFDLWANGGRVEDKNLNPWRGYVYDAICGRIDWDTEPGFTAVAESFRRTYIHFVGQFPRTDAGDVRLVIAQEARDAVALRALAQFQSGKLSDDEAAAALDVCLPWVDQLAEQVREQLRQRAAKLAAGSPDPRAAAAALLALGAVFRGDAKCSDAVATLLACAVETWPQGDPPEGRHTHWQLLWREFQKADTNVRRERTLRAWLKKALGCPKGTSTEAGVLDPSPVLAALAAFQKAGAAPLLPPEAVDWPIELSALRDLSEKVAEYLPKALEEDKDAAVKWLARVDAGFENAEPKQVLQELVLALERATAVGVLAEVHGSLDLADRAKTLSRKMTKALIEGARKAAEAAGSPAQLTASTARNAGLMVEVIEFIEDAEAVLAASLEKAATLIDRFTDGTGAGLEHVRSEGKQLSECIPGLLSDIIGEADNVE